MLNDQVKKTVHGVMKNENLNAEKDTYYLLFIYFFLKLNKKIKNVFIQSKW